MAAITFEPTPLADEAWVPTPRLSIVADVADVRPVNVVFVAVAAVVTALAFAYLAFTPTSPEPGTVPVADSSYVVELGDSMWSIAQDHAPAGTAAAYVERLVAVNGTSVVEVGQVLELPRS